MPLVIDPVLNYSSFLGGGNHDEGFAVAADANGYLYLTGAGQDEYRSRFILHLRQKLTDKEIGIVLANEKPPYSLDQVAAILARHSTDR